MRKSVYLWIAMVAIGAMNSRAISADEKASVQVEPVSCVEDDAAVLARMAVTPYELARTHRPLPELFASLHAATFEGGIDNGWHNNDMSPLNEGEGFDSFSGDFLFPANTTFAVGNGYVVTGTNAGIRYHTSYGQELFSASWSVFFGSVNTGWDFVAQPTIVFDRWSNRWFAVIPAIRSIDTYTWFLVAVSDDANPQGTWKKWSIDSTVNGTQATGNWSDWARLGVDKDAIVVTANMYSRVGDVFQYSKIRCFKKSDLTSFASKLNYSDFWNVVNPDNTKAFSIVPAEHLPGGSPNNQAFFTANNQTSGKINLIAVVGAATTSPLLAKQTIIVPAYARPNFAKQMDSPVQLDCGDGRIQNLLWKYNVLSTAYSVGKENVTAIRWHQVSAKNFPSATLLASGSIYQPGVWQWYPSIAVNKFGTLAVGFSRSSPSERIGIGYSYRAPNDPADYMSPTTIVKAGTRDYYGEGGSPIRWGDYTGTTVDARDDSTFWHYNAYPDDVWGDTWNTWAQPFTAGATFIADCNADQYINGDDYDQFAEWFETGDARSDINHDTFVNGNDYDEFADAFENGY